MHFVALYEGFIIFQISARVSDVGPDVVVQIPSAEKQNDFLNVRKTL